MLTFRYGAYTVEVLKSRNAQSNYCYNLHILDGTGLVAGTTTKSDNVKVLVPVIDSLIHGWENREEDQLLQALKEGLTPTAEKTSKN